MTGNLESILAVADEAPELAAGLLVEHTQGWMRLVKFDVAGLTATEPKEKKAEARVFVLAMAQVEATLAVALYLKALLEKDG